MKYGKVVFLLKIASVRERRNENSVSFLYWQNMVKLF